MDHAIIRPSQSLVKGGGPAAQFRLSDGASVNVWSAAELQAKNERDRVGLRKCIRPSLEGKDSGPRWNALRSLPIYYCSLGRLWTGTGFESAGFDRCAISWFASKPG